MSKENRKRQRPLEEDDEANCSFAAGLNSEWSFNLEEDNGPNIGNGNGNDVKEVKLKMATLEVTTISINYPGHVLKLIFSGKNPNV
jgi:hypothetical protein